MPNNVTTRCIVIGPNEDIKALKELVAVERLDQNGQRGIFFDFNAVVPMPEKLGVSEESVPAGFGAILKLMSADRTGTIFRLASMGHKTILTDDKNRKLIGQLSREGGTLARKPDAAMATVAGPRQVIRLILGGADLSLPVMTMEAVHGFCMKSDTYNQLVITELLLKTDIINRIVGLATEKDGGLQGILPEHIMAAAQSLLNDKPNWHDLGTTRLACISEYGYPSWYSWTQLKWGTCKNAYSLEIVNESDEKLEFVFDTAWKFPTPIFEALSKRFPKLLIECACYEENESFAGHGFFSEQSELPEFRLVRPSPELYRVVYRNDEEQFEMYS